MYPCYANVHPPAEFGDQEEKCWCNRCGSVEETALKHHIKSAINWHLFLDPARLCRTGSVSAVSPQHYQLPPPDFSISSCPQWVSITTGSKIPGVPLEDKQKAAIRKMSCRNRVLIRPVGFWKPTWWSRWGRWSRLCWQTVSDGCLGRNRGGVRVWRSLCAVRGWSQQEATSPQLPGSDQAKNPSYDPLLTASLRNYYGEKIFSVFNTLCLPVYA